MFCVPLVLPKIQANVGGAADALMLDLEGFVSGESSVYSSSSFQSKAIMT